MKAFNVPVYSVEGFEADDVLGTVVEIIQKSEWEKRRKIIIASGDMDTLQLVKEEMSLQHFKKGNLRNDYLRWKAVVERYGFGPELIVDYKALKGDPSDNIIGVKGIGEKRHGADKNTVIENIFAKLKEGKWKRSCAL